MLYKALIRPFLFLFPAERAHYITFSLLKVLYVIPGMRWLLSGLFQLQDARLEREVFGLKFPNPVGLAAGMDKNGRMIDEMAVLGFGFVEIGTVTLRPQEGNDRPRLFRLKDDRALINRMGFNNEGVGQIAASLARRKSRIPVGGNIGKNKLTPNDEAVADYEACFRGLFPYVDYFVVNVSSPNTPGLRALQDKAPLLELLGRLNRLNSELGHHLPAGRKPILLKIAPDLTDAQLDEIIGVVEESGIDGIVATNTTVSRSGLATPVGRVEAMGAGGLSGRPLRSRSTEVIRYIRLRSNGRIPVIGVGGIESPEDALEKLQAGAALVQLYTGFIYEGPSLVKRINRAVLETEKQPVGDVVKPSSTGYTA